MALDKNLFTLNLENSKIEPSALDLVDPSGTVHYRKRMLPNGAGTYLFSLSEPLSDSILATATAPAATSKEKVIELHNPSVIVPLTFKGTLTFKWSFAWEGHDFEWKREACYMIRKPDPPVLVAVTKEPAGKIKTSTIQILDYNLNRFDIDDRKGLEIVLLTSLLTFADHSEQLRTKPNEVPQSAAGPSPVASVVPPPPPKPEGWKEDQIAILQAKEQRDVNEVVIGQVGNVDEYARHCVSLLNDDTLLFITLRSLSPSCVSKVVQVAEATKRTRYKSGGYDDDEELHQYVDMSFDNQDNVKSKAKNKGPRVINLDDHPVSNSSPSPSAAYKPPSTLTIHLSKIAMPELEPKSSRTNKSKFNSEPPHRHTQVASEPEPSKSQVKEKRQSSAGGSTTPPQPASAPTPSGLFAKLSALTSRSSSPPSASRPSSEPHSPPAQPQTYSQTLQVQSHSRPGQSPQPPQPPQPPQHTTPKSYPRPGHSPQSPQQSRPHQPPPSRSQFQALPSQPLHPHPPHLQHAHSHPPPGTYPRYSDTRPQSQPTVYVPPPNPAGHTAPFPGPGSLNTAQVNPAYSMYPAFAGSPAPPPQRASGFFGGSRR